MTDSSRKWKRKKTRTAVTLQLVQGEDDALIQWVERMPPGTRQATIKTALRAFLAEDIELPTQPTEAAPGASEHDLAVLREQIREEIRGELEAREHDTEALREEIRGELEAWYSKAVDDLPGFVRNIVHQHLNSPAQPTTAPPVEEAPTVDEDTLNQRVNRMKKQKW